MTQPIYWQVPAERLCEECAAARWGAAAFAPNFVAPEHHPEETHVGYSWELTRGDDDCTQCHRSILWVAGYYPLDFAGLDADELE